MIITKDTPHWYTDNTISGITLNDSNSYSSNPKRNPVFDALKCFAIFLVLWGHSIQNLSSNDCVENSVYRWIYSFHMPLFMMISGYFSVRSMELNFYEFASKKIKQIVLPGQLWPLIFLIITTICFKNSFKIEFLPYWFLQSLLICYLLSYVGCKFKYGILASFLISQAIPYANVIYMYPAFCVGQLVYKNKESYKLNIKFITLASAIIYMLSMLFWGADDWHLFDQTMKKIQMAGYVKAVFFYLYKTVYKLVIFTSGSMFFFGLFLVCERLWNRGIGKFLAYVGQYTLVVYIIQSYVIEYVLHRCLDFSGLDMMFFSLVISPLFAVVVLLICVSVAFVLDKNKCLRILLLGKKS